jgi:F-type H+-transporting ATPase subunit b
VKKRLIFFFTVLGLSLFCLLALGEEGEVGHEAGIPRVVFYQALNFFGLGAILYFLLRKKVSGYFAKRHDDLTKALREARVLKEEAERKHQEYVLKIKKLEIDAESILNQIRKEGEATKQRITEEAKRLAATIESEAKKAADNEVEKARAELYDEVLDQALKGARSLLTSSVAEKDQLRLQKEFVAKIEAVQ